MVWIPKISKRKIVVSYKENFIGCYEPNVVKELNAEDVASVVRSNKIATGPVNLYDVILKSGEIIVVDQNDKNIYF